MVSYTGIGTHIAHGGNYGLDYLQSNDERFEFWICNNCHFVEAFCLHISNSWNDDGSVLICDTCGLDGT